jgi:hypothetical protein
VGPTGQPHPEADRWGPRPGRAKEKRKGLGSDLGPKGVGLAQDTTRLGSAPWVSSACSSAGRLGPWTGWACRPARLNRPAHGPLLSPLSLAKWDKGAAPLAFPNRRGPIDGHPPDLVWQAVVCARVCRCCVCVRGNDRGVICVQGNDRGVMCVIGGMTEGSCVFEGMTERE